MFEKLLYFLAEAGEMVAASLGAVEKYLHATSHAMVNVAHRLGGAHVLLHSSIFLYHGISGLYRILFKGKTKSLRSKIAKTMMFLCISGCALAASIVVVTVGMMPAMGLLIASSSVYGALMGYRYNRTATKIARLQELSAAIKGGGKLTEDQKTTFEKLMKKSEVKGLLDAEGKEGDSPIAGRIKHLEKKKEERRSKFTISIVNFTFTVALVVLVAVNPILAFALAGVLVVVTGFNIYKESKEVHETLLSKSLDVKESLLDEKQPLLSDVVQGIERKDVEADKETVNEEVKAEAKEGPEIVQSELKEAAEDKDDRKETVNEEVKAEAKEGPEIVQSELKEAAAETKKESETVKEESMPNNVEKLPHLTMHRMEENEKNSHDFPPYKEEVKKAENTHEKSSVVQKDLKSLQEYQSKQPKEVKEDGEQEKERP